MIGLKKMLATMLLAAVVLCMSMPAFAQTMQTQDNILQTARQEGSLKTFVGAVDQAGLRDTLSSGGPYTVFIPDDKAFNRLPADKVNALMADKPKLASVLKYHVVQGRYTSADLAKKGVVTALDGNQLKITSSDHAIAVNGAKIVNQDIPAGNGIIHIIDTVILPSNL